MAYNRLDKLNERLIAFTDLETTGVVPGSHEIIEVGLVVADQKTYEILDTLEIRINPSHIENADEGALKTNGYLERKEAGEWDKAVSLEEAMRQYTEKTKGAIFAAFNATFDWGFMNEAFRTTGVEDTMDYHRLDVLTLAWAKGMKDSPSWSLKECCKHFGVPLEPEVHSALNGAMTCYELYKKLCAV